MRQSTVDQIVRAAEQCGLDVEAFPEYSGRGMYGKTTGGVTISGDSIIGLFAVAVASAAITCDDPDALLDDVRKVRTDSLGRDTIVY